MLDLVWLIPALPLAGFLLILLFGRILGEPRAGILATAMTASSFVVTVGVYLDLLSRAAEERHHVVTLFSWLPVGTLQIDMALLADPLSITMALFVTGIGSLIHLYSIGYMHGDPKFSKFFLYLNLFVFSMLMLVLGENLLVTFLGWEGVGACSYFLISFWFGDEANASASDSGSGSGGTTEEQERVARMRDFLEAFPHVLPCHSCRLLSLMSSSAIAIWRGLLMDYQEAQQAFVA